MSKSSAARRKAATRPAACAYSSAMSAMASTLSRESSLGRRTSRPPVVRAATHQATVRQIERARIARRIFFLGERRSPRRRQTRDFFGQSHCRGGATCVAPECSSLRSPLPPPLHHHHRRCLIIAAVIIVATAATAPSAIVVRILVHWRLNDRLALSASVCCVPCSTHPSTLSIHPLSTPTTFAVGHSGCEWLDAEAS